MKKENKLFQRGDLLLFLGVIFLSLLMLAILIIPKERGNKVTVKSGGETVGTYSLDKNREIPIITEQGENILVIEDGCAYIKEADCPDRLCVNMGKVSEIGESIVCLPHRLSITVIS